MRCFSLAPAGFTRGFTDPVARCVWHDEGVSDRLTALDASFLYMEGPTTPMHVGSVMVFQPRNGGFDYDRLVSLISGRISFVPRYRQCVREVPGRLANPVWVTTRTST